MTTVKTDTRKYHLTFNQIENNHSDKHGTQYGNPYPYGIFQMQGWAYFDNQQPQILAPPQIQPEAKPKGKKRKAAKQQDKSPKYKMLDTRLEHDYPYPCQNCAKRFKRNDHLKKHFEAVHVQIKYTCSFCDKKISRKDHLKRHIGNVHPSMVYSNDSCSGTSVGQRESGQNPPKPKKFPCDYCHEYFSRKDHVTRHVRNVHHNLIPSQPPTT